MTLPARRPTSGWDLWTFPPSLDSELARFLLTHYGVAHREHPHALVFSSFATLRRGTVLFPLVDGDGLRTTSVRRVLEHLDARCAPELRLLPEGGAGWTADWTLFHTRLATATTVLAYYHLLPLRTVMTGPLSRGAPRHEVAAVRRCYPLFAGLLRVLLRLTATRGARAEADLDAVLAEVDRRLSDGRPYLAGDRLTVSDVAFAVAAAPAAWPPQYGGAVPAYEELPPALRSVVDRVRDRPAGAHALRVYREHRRRPATT